MSINRKILLRWIKPLALIFLGVIIGTGTLVLWFCFSATNIEPAEAYDPWEISGHFFEIIGAVGTILAVIVALSKESIMKWLYAPALKTSLVDDGITENIPNENQRVPEASTFECYIRIDNSGSLAALGCRMYISDIKFGRLRSNVKSVKNLSNRQLKWSAPNVDIPVGIPSKVRLFEIVNPNSIGTPSSDTVGKNPTIVFNGCELKKNQSEKGVWVIEYYISSRNGDAKTFTATVEWNGEFKSRATDMSEVLKVQIEEK